MRCDPKSLVLFISILPADRFFLRKIVFLGLEVGEFSSFFYNLLFCPKSAMGRGGRHFCLRLPPAIKSAGVHGPGPSEVPLKLFSKVEKTKTRRDGEGSVQLRFLAPSHTRRRRRPSARRRLTSARMLDFSQNA